MNKKPIDHKERVSLMDTMQTVLIKLSEGNPGALVLFMNMMQDGTCAKIDPQSALGGLGNVLDFDSMGIYGTHAYVLNNDICGGDRVKLMTLLRARQLGFLSGDVLYDISHRQDRSGREIMPDSRIQELYIKVRETLKDFNNINDPRSGGPIWLTKTNQELIGKHIIFNPTKPMVDLDLPLNIEGKVESIKGEGDTRVFTVRELGAKIDSYVNANEVVSIS